ncbi:MAG: cbb3-type cytochrome c oxidase subunit I [Elusimicrobia bacterium]|nr:cbb3-type cytochrome c oxidase subunit I [Elusimicrobiota bacterium]
MEPTGEGPAATRPGARLSPWWKHSAILVVILGFSILIGLTAKSYRNAPPIPERVLGPSGEPVFTGEDIREGQRVFLKHGLMENGSVWGHGAYLGPDFSAAYLHRLALDAGAALKANRYDPATRILAFTAPETRSYQEQIGVWRDYFSRPAQSAGLPAKFIRDETDIRRLTAFFAWTAWASAAARPGRAYSYTNNFPYDPAAGNVPTGDAFFWSALSLIPLLAATALVLFAFGKFNYLGWIGGAEEIHPRIAPGTATESQRATIKYFAVVALLFLAQALVGGVTAHFRADPGNFFGLDLSRWLPSQLARTWHLQLAVIWIATAYVGGGLFLAPALGEHDPPGQVRAVNFLFGALVCVAVGSLLGERLGLEQRLGRLWFWFGHQGWEYLDLGRAWQILLAAALAFWVALLLRGVAPSRNHPERGEISALFLYSAAAIPLFYLPAMFFGSVTNFAVVETWRFWIIHLWVEGFFELFATVMVASIFYELGLVSHLTAARVVYLDAILYLGSGIVGTGHHWYWTGQSSATLALAAMFSAMEVVPLTLLTLDAWDFIQVTRGIRADRGRPVAVPHKWTFYFLMAVGFWNFVGAGVFGFLINLPIVSYFEVGTMLTPNHGHAAMMGVFGMLAVALMVFALRQVSTPEQWVFPEKCVRVSFWGLNSGLALMVASNLFPGGAWQLLDAIRNGYWHARSPEFLRQPLMNLIEWARLPADLIFIALGVFPLALAAGWTYLNVRRGAGLSAASRPPSR